MAESMQAFQVFEGDLSAEALEVYSASETLAVDTETMGLLPWRDRLCLVQLCDEQGHVSAVRIERGQTEAFHLQQLLEADGILKVFHFARFDLAMLRHHLGIQVNPIFCTKIASKLARTYTNKHGLKDLVNELTGVELDKSQQSSDWGNIAALSAEQLDYACNDVRYLISASDQLRTMLTREDRWPLAKNCFGCLPTLVELDLLHYQNIFEH